MRSSWCTTAADVHDPYDSFTVIESHNGATKQHLLFCTAPVGLHKACFSKTKNGEMWAYKLLRHGLSNAAAAELIYLTL